MTSRLLVVAFAGLSAPLLACSSTSTPGTATDAGGADTSSPAPSPDAAVDAGASADGNAGPLVVTPATANVLTCSTLQLTETGGAAGGTWSVSPTTGAGTVSATGSYAAPTVAPAAPATSVTYAVGDASASAQLQVATAFPGTPAPLAIDAGTEDPINAPFEHQMTASGSHVYAALRSATTAAQASYLLEADVFASADNGKTFTGPTVYHTGYLSCATVAVDAGDPNVVYMTYLSGHGDSSGNTGETVRLAVSTDGAKTFPVEYDIVDSINSLANFICPDVTSPSPDHVIVAGVATDSQNDGHVATFASGNRGANIGPVSQPGVATTVNPDGGSSAPTDTNGGSPSGCPVHSGGGMDGPRLATNGKGNVCVVFQYNTSSACTNSDNVAVQCSQDSGATWTSPTLFGAAAADAGFWPTGAVSPSGKVALTWLNTVQTDAGASLIETYVAFSTDGGKTFGTPATYPAASVTAMGGTSLPIVAWENDTVLWLAQTGNVGNAPSLYVDKTCDDGASWSGPVTVAGYKGAGLLLTSAGMVAAGDTGNNSGSAVATIPLSSP